MSNSLQKDTKVLLRRARYEEVWMMPEGSRSELGRLRVLDRGYADFGEFFFWALGCIALSQMRRNSPTGIMLS